MSKKPVFYSPSIKFEADNRKNKYRVRERTYDSSGAFLWMTTVAAFPTEKAAQAYIKEHYES